MSIVADSSPVADGSSFSRVCEAFAEHITAHSGAHQAYARCPSPAHGGDTNPSLSLTWKVNRKGGGQVFIDCKRDCSDRREILAAVGLTPADCYDTPPAGQPDGSAARPRPEKPRGATPESDPAPRQKMKWGKRRATHIYTDANGKPLYDLRRWDGGDIKMAARQYDETGKPIRGSGMPPREARVLYNLPAVLAAIKVGETVYLPEGESDADSAIKHGLVATCNFGGAADTESRAASVWLPQYVETLRGAHVVIVADIDPLEQGRSGYRHALVLLDSLTGVAASVRVTEPPEPKDLRDHLDKRGGVVDDLVTLTRDALVKRIAEADAFKAAQAAEEPEADDMPPADETPREGDSSSAGDRRSGRWVVHRGRIVEDCSTVDKDGNPVPDFRPVLGCDARITRQYLGGLVGDARQDKAAAGRLEQVEMVLTHPDPDAPERTRTLVLTDREWRSGDWLDGLWPDVEFDHGRTGRSRIARAIRAVSLGAVQVSPHTATGWRTLEGHGRAFIHAGGAITAAGLVTDVVTDLPGPLAHYRLPAPPTTPEALRAAADHTIGLLTDEGLCPRVGAVMAAVPWRAVLGRAGFVPVFMGSEGSGKTALSIAMCGAFGGSNLHRDMDYAIQMHEHGASSKAAALWLNIAADVVLPFDDFAPDSGPLPAAQKMGAFVRAAYNGGGRPVLTRERKMKEGEPPRTVPMISAELEPAAGSARGRMLMVPPMWAKNAADVKVVQRLQSAEAMNQRGAFMAALLQWLAGFDEAAVVEWVRRLESDAAEALRAAGFSVRQAEHVSRLAAGWRVALRMMAERGAWSASYVDEFWSAQVWPALTEVARHASAEDSETNPGRQLVALVGDALMAGDAHLIGEDGMYPDGMEPVAAGWRPGSREGDWLPTGQRVGVVKRDRLLLLPDDALAVASARARVAGQELGLQRVTASAVLHGAGIGLRTTFDKDGKEHRTVKARIAGKPTNVWDLPLSVLLDDDPGTGGGNGGGSGAVPPTPDAPPVVPPEAPTVPTGCRVCGEPLPAVALAEGHDTHASCDDSLGAPDTSPVPAPEAPTFEDVPLPEPPDEHPEPEPVADTSDTSSSVGEPVAPPTRPTREDRRPRRGEREGLTVSEDEVREAVAWAERADVDPLTEAQAAAVVERWHAVTGCRWQGPHGTIWAMLTGHTRWPGAKGPGKADLGLFDELRESDADPFWRQRMWVADPSAVPVEGALVQAVDVNAQYVAAASSVELGEGSPVHYEPGDPLPENVMRLPGWLRLAEDVPGAPHGLALTAGVWVPTPIIVYLVRDHGLALTFEEALVWEKKRRHLAPLARSWGKWSAALKPAAAEGDRAAEYALGMLKTVYTKALGGYLSSEKGLTPEEWHRPDWAALLRAQAEANMLRALDKLPEGCTPRALYADTAFVECSDPAVLDEWHRLDKAGERVSFLDPALPGRWKRARQPVPAAEFVGLRSAESWRQAYIKAQPSPDSPSAGGDPR